MALSTGYGAACGKQQFAIYYPRGNCFVLFPMMVVILALSFYFYWEVSAVSHAAGTQPIAELTQSARYIHTRKDILADAGLRDLTGTIDNIDAAGLIQGYRQFRAKELKELPPPSTGF